jgi:ribose transport system permease protein
VILTGGIDLSVGSTLAVSAAFCAGMIAYGNLPTPLAMFFTLIIGLLLGSVNGVLITRGKLQPFIATLITMTAYRGITLIFMGGRPISNLSGSGSASSDILTFFGKGSVAGVPFPVIMFIVMFVIFFFILHMTTMGRKVYGVGSNARCAQLAGISISRVKMAVYSISGLMAALSGMVLLSRLNSAQPTLGGGYELDAIASVALGGTSMNGGRGKILGTLIGVLIIAVLNNGLNILGVSSYYQDVVKGVVILIAVLSDKNK